MVKVEDISWGSYQDYEGPFYRGSVKFVLPNNPTITDKRLAMITAVESGHYDAINMYDRMIVTVGLIQWGEANTFSVSRLLGAMCDSNLEPVVQLYLSDVMMASGASFKKNGKGLWRFFVNNLEVNSIAAQQSLFLKCDGRKGSWTDDKKIHAKRWAAALASLLSDPRTIEVQKKYTSERLLNFVMADAKKILFDDKDTSNWAEATRAIYLTFAINLPRIAGEMLSSTRFVGKKWSQEWCLSIIKRLTFGPNIRIYPIRYDALRPLAEKLYGIELPKKSSDLNLWKYEEQAPVGSINQQLIEELNDIVVSKKQSKPNPVSLEKINFFSFVFDSLKGFFSRK